MRAKQLQRTLRAVAPLLAILMIVFLAGCDGDTNPGEGEPKRAVDPRSEALRYFPATTPAIGLVELGDDEALTELDEALADVSGWVHLRDRVARSLRAAGIDPEHILDLGSNPADEIELPAAEIAFGTVPGSGPAESRILITLATEQGVALDKTFRDAAEAGGLQAAGEFDGARLYRGPDLDFAVRDGVLIAAADVNRLQQAIARRDGERDTQLNDAPITALLNELPQRGKLRAWAGPGAETDALISLVAAGAGQQGAADSAEPAAQVSEAAVEVGGDDGKLGVEMIIKSEGAGAPASGETDEPSEDEPVPLSISPEMLKEALAELPPSSPLHDLSPVAPLAGAAWIDGSSLRARLISAR